MKCDKCIGGKSLPLIPIPNMNINKFPDCHYCDGTGVFKERDEELSKEGSKLKDIRLSNRKSLRSFCIENNLNPITINKIESGLSRASKKVVACYESLNSQTKN